MLNYIEKVIYSLTCSKDGIIFMAIRQYLLIFLSFSREKETNLRITNIHKEDKNESQNCMVDPVVLSDCWSFSRFMSKGPQRSNGLEQLRSVGSRTSRQTKYISR